MDVWYRLAARDDGTIEVQFRPHPDRFWPTEELRDHRLEVPRGAAIRSAKLSGSASIWMAAHAAAVLRRAGVESLSLQTPHAPGSCDDPDRSSARLFPANDAGRSAALLRVHLQTAPPLSQRAIDRLLEPCLEELTRTRPTELVLCGRAPIAVYAHAAWEAVDASVRRLSCWSARDGLIVVDDPDPRQLGRRVPLPDWVDRIMPRPKCPRILGVTGDPNRGKSIFSAVLDAYRHRVGCDGWRLDCDGQAPTPAWYLSLTGVSEEQARRLREADKRPWTPEMETAIADQMRRARRLFEVLIADLPGGNHKAQPPMRVPEGRERLFQQVDALILLAGEGDGSERAWREALRPHGLEDRIACVLTSSDPKDNPSLEVRRDGTIWRGRVRGLDRSRTEDELMAAFAVGLERLWHALLHQAASRARSPKLETPPTGGS